MNKKEIINALKKWDTEMVVVFNSTTGQYYNIISISRGLGKGILLEVK